MTLRTKRPSPTLSAVVSTIDSAASPLVTTESGFSHSFEIDLDRINTGPQPRTIFDQTELDALARSLQEHGQLQPIIVRRDPERRNAWLLVAGERRLRAARSLGWKRLLAMETSSHPEAVALVENLQRANLTPLEEARGIQRLLNSLSMSQRDVARLLGKHESDISRIQRILTLPESFLAAVENSQSPIERELLVELARLPDSPLRTRLMSLALEGKLTVRGLREARDTEPGAKRRLTRADPSAAARIARGLSAKLRLIADQATPLTDKELRSLRELRDEIDRAMENAARTEAPDDGVTSDDAE